MLIGLIAIVIVIAIFQLSFFLGTKKMITRLWKFFPDIKSLAVVPFNLSEAGFGEELRNKIKDASLQSKSGADTSSEGLPSQYTNVISAPDYVSENHSDFFDVLLSTNYYMCKNSGAAADLSLLQEPCEKQIEKLESEVENSLNTPLYCGLGGTFIGIIFGLIGLFVNAQSSGADKVIGFSDIQSLLVGVAIAMCASLFGLVLTVLNSSIFYKRANSELCTSKQDYYDFLRQELMPVLTTSMASSLNSLKSVLGHFIDKFGRNLDAYSDSAELLNDNLEKQHLVLKEINELDMTQTATSIAEAFKTLKDSSASLKVFRNYQDDLNATIRNLSSTTSQIEAVISSFQNFSTALGIVAKNQVESNVVMQKFTEAIETHFPTGSEGRDAWRREFDTLISDAQSASRELQNQLAESTRYIKSFTDNNTSFFASLEQMQTVLASLVQYADIQSRCYTELSAEIQNLRRDCKSDQEENIRTRQDIVNALGEMTDALKCLQAVKSDIVNEARKEIQNAIKETQVRINQIKK